MSNGWTASTYGDAFASVYDEWYGSRFDTEGAVATLAELAGAGPVLELGVGTGRLAIPLAALGLEVHGMDASTPMLERLRAKPGGERVRAVLGDMADVGTAVDARYSLVFAAFSTLFNLATRDAQARCVVGVAERLHPGGAFVVEAFVPDPERLSQPDSVRVRSIEPGRLVLDATRVDVDSQVIESVTTVLEPAGTRLYPLRIRYTTPSELDGLARLAGLELEARWGSWRREPFTDDSPAHVSVYRRGGADGRRR